MQLNTNRLLSDRLVFDLSVPEKLRVTNSFWDWCQRIISWIWSPSSYSAENRRTIACFKKYLIDTLGEARLKRICARYFLDLDAKETKGSPLLSRDVAKIVIGARNVTVEDIEDFQNLDSAGLAQAYQTLRDPFGSQWQVADIAKRISGRPTDWTSRIFYDPFLADRERMQVCRENPTDSFEIFVHNMVARVIKREMDVGTLIQAPNHPSGRPQFYYVSAKIVTGKGMVSYIFHPATVDTNLEPIRLFRGTAARNSEIDGLSTVITDLERDLGRTAYESGELYESILQQRGLQPLVEGGHSMGSTLVQYRLANLDHIRTAYLFSGPGLPEKEVRKFNQKDPAVHLIIRQSVKDRWSNMGEVHLGYQSPPNVLLDYQKYHMPRKKTGHNPHVTVWAREKLHYGIEGGMTSRMLDLEFYHKNHHQERFRSTFGPFFSRILRTLQHWCHCRFPSRTELERGLKIGSLQKGRWQVDHFRTV